MHIGGAFFNTDYAIPIHELAREMEARGSLVGFAGSVDTGMAGSSGSRQQVLALGRLG